MHTQVEIFDVSDSGRPVDMVARFREKEVLAFFSFSFSFLFFSSSFFFFFLFFFFSLPHTRFLAGWAKHTERKVIPLP